MITVGVGSDIFMDELQQIATSPRKVFRSDFAGLSDLIGQLRDLICQGTLSNLRSLLALERCFVVISHSECMRLVSSIDIHENVRGPSSNLRN